MKQTRRNVFETNSSSTHSICISKAPVTAGKCIYFRIGEFGWENDCVDTTDYLYTAILEQGDSDELLEKLKGMLDKHSVEYEFEEPEYDTSSDGNYKWLSYGYIDHSESTREFIDAVLSDDDMLIRCLFGPDSCVYTGNDNQDPRPAGCNIAEEFVWEYENGNWVKKLNPHHNKDKFDYFYKEN